MAIHFPGDYGDDHAAGVKAAAAATGLTFINIKTDPGADRQSGAVAAILARRPDLVTLAVDPAETAVIVQGAADGGFTGMIVGASPSWDPELLRGPAASALFELYQQTSPWPPWSTDTPGHRAMREALGSAGPPAGEAERSPESSGPASQPAGPREGLVAGWISSYPLKAALAAAADSGELTRAGLARAARGLRSVDYEGMQINGTNDYTGELAGLAAPSMILSPARGGGVAEVPVMREFFRGELFAGFRPDGPCFQDL
jgi:ABC-type branched-subunit amino acid transport system substrate-binding protein